MGHTVSAAQAARLVNKNEKTIRLMLASGALRATKAGANWAIDVDALARVPGWQVDPHLLAQISATDPAAIAALFARVAELEQIVEELQHRPAAAVAGLPAPTTPQKPSVRYIAPPSQTRGPAPRGAAALQFAFQIDGARWLHEHGGTSVHTVRSWPEYKTVQRTPRAFVSMALRHYQPGYSPWGLTECDDPGCTCHTLLRGMKHPAGPDWRSHGPRPTHPLTAEEHLPDNGDAPEVTTVGAAATWGVVGDY